MGCDAWEEPPKESLRLLCPIELVSLRRSELGVLSGLTSETLELSIAVLNDVKRKTYSFETRNKYGP
jgi:hypothetical protein